MPNDNANAHVRSSWFAHQLFQLYALHPPGVMVPHEPSCTVLFCSLCTLQLCCAVLYRAVLCCALTELYCAVLEFVHAWAVLCYLVHLLYCTNLCHSALQMQ